jgi:hypothetical protein
MRTSFIVVLAALALISLQGCATLTGTATQNTATAGAARSMSFLSQKTPAGARTPEITSADLIALRKSLDDDFASVRGICAPILYGYKEDTRNASMFAFGLQVLGTLAGAVVVPSLAAMAAAPKSVIAAWGGVAGVTNTLQHTAKDVALGPASQYTARESLRSSLLSLTKQFTDKFASFPNDVMVQIGILNQMKAECDFPPIPIPGDVTALPLPGGGAGGTGGGGGGPT